VFLSLRTMYVMAVAYTVRMARSRKPRGSLSPGAILDAAERVASQNGSEALTMRAVAAELDAAPMALYRHLATKDDLVDALLDRVLGRFEPPPTTRSWRADLKAFAQAHRRLLMDHPWAVPLLFTHASPGLNATRIGELAFGILRRGRLNDTEVVATFSGLIALNYGWSAFAVPRIGAETETDITAVLQQLPRHDYPITVDVAAEMGDYASDRHYELVLDRFLAGVRPSRTAGARRA
jgi:AcrR family transcriptional regulator